MKKITGHPRKQLKATWIDLIRKEAAVAEESGQLTAKQLALFYKQGWFKALVPKKYGGLEWSLSKVVRFEEAIGWTDGSAGWVFTLCSGAGWFGGFMDPGLAMRTFKAKKACVAGSGAVSGRAVTLPSGDFKVSGAWKYATGAPHATLFTANCQVVEHAGISKDSARLQHLVRVFCFLKKEVEILRTWKPLGLIASASESFKADLESLPAGRVFDIDTRTPVVPTSLYRVPFKVLAEATIAANLSGMALHFMEEVDILWRGKYEYASEKDDHRQLKQYQQLLDQQLTLWTQCRNNLMMAVRQLEAFIKASKDLHFQPTEKFKNLSDAVSEGAQRLAISCRRLVFDLYGHCGLTAATTGTPLNTVWRDFQTGSQHAIFEAALPLL